MTTSAERIENEFSKYGITEGGILMLKPPDAIRLVLRCRDEGVRILGIDAFLLTPSTTQPVMEHSVDFTSQRFPSDVDTHQVALRFLQDRLDTKYYFEVVLGE